MFLFRCLLEYTSEAIRILFSLWKERKQEVLFLCRYKAVFVTSLAVQCLRSSDASTAGSTNLIPMVGKEDHAFLTIWPKKNRAVHVAFVLNELS